MKPVYDEEMGLTLDTVKAYRYDEEYAQTSGEKGKYKFNWVSRGTKTLTGEGALGGFSLDASLLEALPVGEYYSDFDVTEISVYETDISEIGSSDRIHVLVNADYYYGESSYDVTDGQIARSVDRSAASDREGAWAHSYKTYDAAGYEAMTIAGVQQGNVLVALDALGPVVETGVLTHEELMKNVKGSSMYGTIAFLVIGCAMVFLGLFRSKKSNKRKKG